MPRPEYELLAQLRAAAPTPPATHLRLIQENDAEGATAEAYQYFRDQTGRTDVPGIVKCFGINPPAVRHMIDLSSSLLFNDSFLNRRQKELIATWVSHLNACPYCLDSHGFFLLVHGGARQALDSLSAGDLDHADLTPAEQLLLTYVEKVNGASFRITREDVDALLTAGWTEDQIAETVHVTAMMGLCNRVANAFGLPSQNYLALTP
jgi:uncharacterized peroxidase-related enzyme